MIVAMTAPLPHAPPLPSRSRLFAQCLPARIETALAAALARATGPGCPPRLAAALRAAVFPGGARLRPQLCRLAAYASGDADPALADSAACALELLHCASLVHDDLPCFDDADTRRGLPTVHKAFGQPLAVLAGDALIVLAFETLAAEVARASTGKASTLLALLARAAGPTRGITAGQAWESEPAIPLDEYHRCKTGALFEAAVVMGALAGGGDGEAWRPLGDRLGRAYQAADDLQDRLGRACGKASGKDAALGRPNLAHEVGIAAARRRVGALLTEAHTLLPAAPEAGVLVGFIDCLTQRLLAI